MASSDNTTTPFSQIDGQLFIESGGADSIECQLVQMDPDWTEEGETYVEARVRNQHQSTVVLRKTGDGNCSLSLDILISSFRSLTSVTPYEALTGTGLASAWTAAGLGDRHNVRLRFLLSATGAGGAAQTITFPVCVAANTKVGKSDGLYHLTSDITAFCTSPTIT